MSKKRYTLVLTLVFCLTATLFIVASTGYDPWLDHDEDGDVDTDDLYLLAGEYGSSGDPTKNVTVTNWPTPPEPKTIVVCQNLTVTSATPYGHIFATANVTGYRYVSIFVAYYRPYNNAPGIRCDPSSQNIASSSDGSTGFYSRNIDTSQLTTRWEYRCSTGFEVGAPYVAFRIWISNDSIELTIVLYCYN